MIDTAPNDSVLRKKLQRLADASYAPYSQKLLASNLPLYTMSLTGMGFDAGLMTDNVTGEAKGCLLGDEAKGNRLINTFEHEAVHFDQSLRCQRRTSLSLKLEDSYKFTLISELEAFAAQEQKTIIDFKNNLFTEEEVFEKITSLTVSALQDYLAAHFGRYVSASPNVILRRLESAKNQKQEPDTSKVHGRFYQRYGFDDALRGHYINNTLLGVYAHLKTKPERLPERPFSLKFDLDDAVDYTRHDGLDPIGSMPKTQRRVFWENLSALSTSQEEILDRVKIEAAQYAPF